ncbi:Phytochelatin synthase [Diplonema papillatum]|nr:Phytochelatin synthase [Diplonema papillatum]
MSTPLTEDEKKRKGQYLKDKDVPHLVNDLLLAMTDSMPDEPVAFIRDWAKGHKRVAGQAHPQGVVTIGRRVSLSLDSTVVGDSDGDTPSSTAKSGSSMKKPTLKGSDDGKRSVSVLGGADGAAINENTGPSQGNRRPARRNFFASYATPAEVQPGEKPPPQLPCQHLGCLAVALSFLLKYTETPPDGDAQQQQQQQRVTIEDIFFRLKLPLHYLHNPGMTLSELHDIALDYIEADPRFTAGGLQILVKKVNFDPELLDDHEFSSDAPGRPPMCLTDFRSALAVESQRVDMVRIFHYDHVLVEQGGMKFLDEDESEEDELDETARSQRHSVFRPTTSSASKLTEGWLGAKSRGRYSIFQEFNALKHEVVLRNPKISEGGILLGESRVALPLLHRSFSSIDGFCQRARGFLEFSVCPAPESSPVDIEDRPVQSVLRECVKFHPRLLLGTGSCGTRLGNVHPDISTHLVALAFSLHLLCGQTGDGGGQLGIDIGSLVCGLNLPLSLVCDHSMSLKEVYAFAHRYLKEQSGHKQLQNARISLHSMQLANPWDPEAAPPISLSDLENAVKFVVDANTDPSKPACIMLLCFNANKAHQSLGLDRVPSHYGVLAGYDAAGSTVIVADVHPKKYTKFSLFPLFRLHEAMVGHGYLLFTQDGFKVPDDVLSSAHSLASSTDQGSNLHAGTAKRPDYDFIPHFPFPPRIFSVTILSMALHRLGAKVYPEQLATLSSYDVSFMLSYKLSIFDCQRVLRRYIAAHLDDEYTTETCSLDKTHRSVAQNTSAFFAEMQKLHQEDAEGGKTATVLFYNASLVSPDAAEQGGNAGLLAGVSEENGERVITVMDANASAHYRHWSVSAEKLLSAMLNVDPESSRPRSFLRIRREKDPGLKGLDVPTFRKVKVHHPLKAPPFPQLTCLAFCFSYLGLPSSAENVFYAGHLALVSPSASSGSGQGLAPWRRKDFHLAALKKRLTTTSCAALGQKYLSERGSSLTVSAEPPPATAAELQALIEQHVSAEKKSLLCFAYNPTVVHPGVVGVVGYAVAYHLEGDVVHCADVNPSKYGLTWSQSVSVMHTAIKKKNDQSSYGIICFAA